MLEEVKKSLGITGDYQDGTVTGYIEEVKAFMVDAGVSPEVANSGEAAGVVSRGVADLWNYGAGNTELSKYFMQRVTQLCYKGGTGG